MQDENGNYLLDAENKFIILSQEQINTLKETNLLVSDDSWYILCSEQNLKRIYLMSSIEVYEEASVTEEKSKETA